MPVGLGIDPYQILKDLNSAVKKLKDKTAQTEINSLLAELTGAIRDKETELYKLDRENRELSESKKYIFAPGRMYLIDPDDPDRKLCPVCTKKLKIAVPVSQTNGYCSTCERYYN